MSFNFGIIFAGICIIGGLLMIILYKPYWWLMKKQEMPNHYKWYLRIPGILLILFGIGIVAISIDKILVSEREKMADGTVKQEIKIYYKFIGFVGELHITPTKRWTALPPKNCMVCGVEYVPGSGISKYCPACAKRIQREKSNESKRRSREQKRMVCIELSAKNDRLTLNSRKGGF